MKTIEYEESFGEPKLPDGFTQKLAGRSLQEQMACYRITESTTLARTAYGEVSGEQCRERSHRLDGYPDCTGLVVRDGLLVGALIKEWPYQREAVCLPYQRVCTYYASDNDGSGTNDRADYAYLICV